MARTTVDDGAGEGVEWTVTETVDVGVDEGAVVDADCSVVVVVFDRAVELGVGYGAVDVVAVSTVGDEGYLLCCGLGPNC